MTIDTTPETITDAIDALRATGQPSTADLLEALAGELARLKRRVASKADEITEQVAVTRAYAGDCGMDSSQVTLMEICTGHFLDYARDLRALTQGTPQ
jgi:hypothetical protein